MKCISNESFHGNRKKGANCYSLVFSPKSRNQERILNFPDKKRLILWEKRGRVHWTFLFAVPDLVSALIWPAVYSRKLTYINCNNFLSCPRLFQREWGSIAGASSSSFLVGLSWVGCVLSGKSELLTDSTVCRTTLSRTQKPISALAP